ncbi:MAG TPA: DUF4349 domain-containing protein [Pseudonocardia sp.]|jgi:hypothetical protein|nr:DUF4349 domain-containing protein [Pseudonocardia sp.]
MSGWRRAGAVLGGVARRRPVRLASAGVVGLVVLALTWVTAVVSVSGPGSTSGAEEVAVSPSFAARPGAMASSGPAGSERVGSGAVSSEAVGSVGGAPDSVAEPVARTPELGTRIAAPTPSPGDPGPGDLSPGDPGQPVDVSGAAPDRAVVRTARLELTVGDVAAVSARVRAMVAGVGGFVAGEQSVDRSANFTLRIPAPRLDEVIGQLGGAGRVTLRSEQADDVTDQVTDLDGRLASQRAGVARIRALLEKANSVGDVVMIESELTQREADLESLQRRLASVSGRVAMSTLSVALTPIPAPDAQPGRDGFLAGLAAGWHAFLAAAGSAATVLGAVLPFLVVLALLAGLALAGRRLLARRRRRPASTPDSV